MYHSRRGYTYFTALILTGDMVQVGQSKAFQTAREILHGGTSEIVLTATDRESSLHSQFDGHLKKFPS